MQLTMPGTEADAASDASIGRIVSVTGSKAIALTFDDGPDPVQTPKILALLDKYHVKATFCLIGTNVEKHPEIVARLEHSRAGHADAAHVRAVLAAEIQQRRAHAPDDEPGVLPRDLGRVQPDAGGGIAPHDVLAVFKRKLAGSAHQ